MQLKRRIKKVEHKYYPPIDVRDLSDEELEKLSAEYHARAPKQAAALQTLIQSLPDEELEIMRDGRNHLFSIDTRRRLKHANQIKG